MTQSRLEPQHLAITGIEQVEQVSNLLQVIDDLDPFRISQLIISVNAGPHFYTDPITGQIEQVFWLNPEQLTAIRQELSIASLVANVMVEFNFGLLSHHFGLSSVLACLKSLPSHHLLGLKWGGQQSLAMVTELAIAAQQPAQAMHLSWSTVEQLAQYNSSVGRTIGRLLLGGITTLVIPCPDQDQDLDTIDNALEHILRRRPVRDLSLRLHQAENQPTNNQIWTMINQKYASLRPGREIHYNDFISDLVQYL